MQALLLSHPWQQTRDTQVYAHRHKLVKTKYAALRNLVQQELGVAIQTGEHSSVRRRLCRFRRISYCTVGHRRKGDHGCLPAAYQRVGEGQAY